MNEKCKLHSVIGLEDWCTREKCIYWRLLEAQDEDVSNASGCGLQHFKIIEELEPAMAGWLLEVKKRLENTDPDKEIARITFKRREK